MNPAHSTAETIIKFLKDHNQYDLLPEVADLLQKEAYRSQTISVISALAIDKKEQAELEKVLVKKWGEHDIVYTIDPNLLSGFLIRFQNQLLDFTGKNHLSQLSAALK